ncbi:MAG: flagellar hook-associated protein FlgK [Planctomycetes bacterium]|nr:flagellar hook-associated protein FlgK [Planctomycetota bacterium]
MTSFFTGISALQTSQRALDTIGNNVANANTPGYHRQIASLGTRTPFQLGNLSFGRGVQVMEIRRARAEVIEATLTRQQSVSGDIDRQLDGFFRMESRLAVDQGSVTNLVQNLFNRLEQLTVRLDDSATRQVVAKDAAALTQELNDLTLEFRETQVSLRTEIQSTVREVNSLSSRIANLNEQIRRSENRGAQANDLRDQRDQLVNDLAQRINVQLVEQSPGELSVFASGLPLVVSNRALDIEVVFDPNGQATVQTVDTDTPVQLNGGRLNAQLRLRNEVLPETLDRLETLARELILAFDPVQATGHGVGAPITSVTSQRPVSDVNALLNDADLTFPPQAGSLFVGVTDLSTGQRTIAEVLVDPAQQRLGTASPPAPNPATSLSDALAAVANIDALVNTQTGQITVRANPGFAVDFAGGFEAAPDTSGLTAATTTTPTIGGVYTGPDNDNFTFTFLGTGVIGQTPGLQVEVRDLSNNIIATLDVGAGYTPGEAIDVADRVTVSFTAGNAAAGESFSSEVIGRPDTAGILTALGLNTFFAGDDASNIRVNGDILNDADRIATSRGGEVGEGLHLETLVALRDSQRLAGGTQTFLQFTSTIIDEVSIEVRSLTDLQETSQLLAERLEAERQGISGVDPNEELVQMIRFQRQFEIAARFISTVNEALDSLLQIA